MEHVSELKKRLHEAEMRMARSERPEEFKHILSQFVPFNDAEVTVEKLLDIHPRMVIDYINKGIIADTEYIDDFLIYVRDIRAMRNNFFIRPGESWREFFSHPHTTEPSYDDHYSKHEMM